jgi:exodeoxyribonuclease X
LRASLRKNNLYKSVLYAESEKARTPTTMPFGKHKGMLLTDVPSDYKQWLLTQGGIDPYLRKALET